MHVESFAYPDIFGIPSQVFGILKIRRFLNLLEATQKKF